MLILLNPYGQRSNMLLQFVHLHSFCLEHGVYFYDKHVLDMHEDYPNLNSNNYAIDAAVALKLPQILKRLSLIKYINFTNENELETYKSTIVNYKLVTCDGWFFRSNDTVVKYRELYQHLFKPNVEEQELKHRFLHKRLLNEKIIGLHIRRGDYIEHENGIYFYDDQTYLNKIEQLCFSLNAENVSCKFILFSNDVNLNIELYMHASADVIVSKESALVDHYLMSQCDYLMGVIQNYALG